MAPQGRLPQMTLQGGPSAETQHQQQQQQQQHQQYQQRGSHSEKQLGEQQQLLQQTQLHQQDPRSQRGHTNQEEQLKHQQQQQHQPQRQQQQQQQQQRGVLSVFAASPPSASRHPYQPAASSVVPEAAAAEAAAAEEEAAAEAAVAAEDTSASPQNIAARTVGLMGAAAAAEGGPPEAAADKDSLAEEDAAEDDPEAEAAAASAAVAAAAAAAASGRLDLFSATRLTIELSVRNASYRLPAQTPSLFSVLRSCGSCCRRSISCTSSSSSCCCCLSSSRRCGCCRNSGSASGPACTCGAAAAGEDCGCGHKPIYGDGNRHTVNSSSSSSSKPALVLSGISCCFPSHTVTAILGGSGAGKSTLLSLISGRLRPLPPEALKRDARRRPHAGGGAVTPERRTEKERRLKETEDRETERDTNETGRETGDRRAFIEHRRPVPELLLNGVAAPKGWRRLVGFCLQQDLLLLQQLSVQQTLLLEAKLRLGRVCSKQQRRQRVDKVIQMMNLEKCRNTLVGSPFSRGLSGGERRRLSVACELLLPKPLLLLDEPTSGLDAAAASHLLRLLQQVARENGTAVVCSIHQPSSQLFLSFDRVVFLSEGHLVFCGQPQQLRGYEALLLQPPPSAIGSVGAAAAASSNAAAAAAAAGSAQADPTGAVAAAAGAMVDAEQDISAVAAPSAPGATAAAAEAAEAATATRPDCCVAEHFLGLSCGVGAALTQPILTAHLRRLLLLLKQQHNGSSRSTSNSSMSSYSSNNLLPVEETRGLMVEIERLLQQQQQQRQKQQLLVLQETEQRHQEAQGVAQILDLTFRVYRDHKTLVLRDDFQAIAAAATAAEAAATAAAARARASARQGESCMHAVGQTETRIAVQDEVGPSEGAVRRLSPLPDNRGGSASLATEAERAAAAVPASAAAAAAAAAAAKTGAASLQQVSIHQSSSGAAAAAAAASAAKRRELLAAAAAIKAASSPLLQFEVLLQRQLIAEARGKAAAADVIQALILGVIVGSMYFQQMKHYTTDTLHERLALLYFLCNYHIFSPAFTSLNAFPAIRAAAAAGSSSKLFAATTFLAASSCAELLLQLLAPLAMLLLLHIMVAWPSNVGVFLAVWLSLMLLTIISSSLGQLIAALAGSDHRLGALLLSVSLISLTLVGGFYISLNLLPPWVGWLVYLSPVSYAIPNLLHATLGSRLIACSGGTSSGADNSTGGSSDGSSIGGDLGCTGDGLTAQQVAEGTSLGLPVAANVAVLFSFLFVIKAATLVLLKRRLQIQN